MTSIKPAGMTMKRAMEIAMGSDERRAGALNAHIGSDNGNGFRLNNAQRGEIIRLAALPTSTANIALRLGVSDRTVNRVLAEERDAKAWRAAERRRQNLDSFRRMETEWTEIPA